MTDSYDDLNIGEFYAFAIDISKRAGQLLVDASSRTEQNHVIASTREAELNVTKAITTPNC